MFSLVSRKFLAMRNIALYSVRAVKNGSKEYYIVCTYPGSYKWIIMLEKCGLPGINVFHIKWQPWQLKTLSGVLLNTHKFNLIFNCFFKLCTRFFEFQKVTQVFEMCLGVFHQLLGSHFTQFWPRPPKGEDCGFFIWYIYFVTWTF